jgi:hypothetical protein
MALIEEVVTRYSLQDDYSAGLDRMAQKTEQFADSVKGAQRQTDGFQDAIKQVQQGGGSGGFLAPFMGGATGGGRGGFGGALLGVVGRFGVMAAVLGAVVIGANKFNEALTGINDFFKGLAEGGGLLTQIMTFPGKVVIAFNEAIGKLFSSLTMSIIPIFDIATNLVNLPLTITNAAIGMLAKSLEALVGILGQVAQIVSQIGGQLLGAFMSIAGQAIQVATEFDSLKRSFTALLGSEEAGGQLADFLRTWGQKSPFDQQPIFEAARAITAAGESVSRFLPLMERIALLRGGGAENLRDVANLFQMLFGGNVGRVFGPMGLGRFGIGKQQLEEHGARFDKGGQFIGDVADAVAVLERLLASDRFKNLNAIFEDAPATKLSNAIDSVNKALESMGKTILGFVLPYVEEFAGFVSALAEGGYVERLTKQFGEFLGLGSGDTAGFRSFLEHVAAILINLPSLISGIWEVVKRGGQMLLELMTTMWDTMAALTNTMISKLEGIINVIQGVLRGLIPFYRGQGVSFPRIPTVEGAIGMGKGLLDQLAAGGVFDDFLSGVSQTRDELSKLGTGGANVVDPTAGMTAIGLQQQIAEATEETARNTRDLVDLSRTALGGGDIGRHGIQAIEGRSVRGGEIRVRVSGATDSITRAMSELFERMLADYERQRSRLVPGRQ